MLYRIGTVKEIDFIRSKFPVAVIEQLHYCTKTLDNDYGADRNYLQSGGYSLLAEKEKDLAGIRAIIDFEEHPCEWADSLDGGFLSALYLLNDDFSVVVFMSIGRSILVRNILFEMGIPILTIMSVVAISVRIIGHNVCYPGAILVYSLTKTPKQKMSIEHLGCDTGECWTVRKTVFAWVYILWNTHFIIMNLQRLLKRERMTNMNIEKAPQPKKRTLLLSEKISQSSVKKIIEEIFEINEDDRQNEEIYKNWKSPPIELFINSYGGFVYDGLALVDVIRQSKTPVHTICVGSCMSMGMWIWLVGSKRLIGANGTLMFHDLFAFAVDKTEGIKQELNEMLRLQEKLIGEITGKSLVQKETLQDYIVRKAEWYIPAEQAVSLKLADGYYK